MKFFPIILLSLCLFGLEACGNNDGQITEPPGDVNVGNAVHLEDIFLASGDKVRLTVFGEDDLSGEYQVDTEGYIAVPLAGAVKAAGLTKGDLQNVISEKLKSFLRTPRVTVTISSFRPFYILGEVEKPGEYDYKSGLNVLSAMALAGGATYRASHSNVLIQRGGVGTFHSYPMSPEIKVLPGDLIKIPERFF